MKTFLTCCLAALLGFGLLAARPAQAKQHLLLGSSIVGGSYYVLGGTYAKYINDTYPDLDVSVEVGGGPYSNIILLSNGEIDLGFATTWATGEMYDGINDQKKKHEDIRGVPAPVPQLPPDLLAGGKPDQKHGGHSGQDRVQRRGGFKRAHRHPNAFRHSGHQARQAEQRPHRHADQQHAR